ncbi:hypothetical protein ABE178_16025 [Priestia megaterium]
MFKYSAAEIKKNLFIQTIELKHGIEDARFVDFLRNSLDDDMDLYLHDIYNSLDLMFDFHFEWIDVPNAIHEEHADGWNYYIIGAFRIPELLPYANHPAFIEFTRNIQLLHSKGGGNLVEFVYLPDSTMATSEEPIFREFARQPATFMIGMQDNGGIDVHTTIEFLLELREINEYIYLLLEPEGRENIA